MPPGGLRMGESWGQRGEEEAITASYPTCHVPSCAFGVPAMFACPTAALPTAPTHVLRPAPYKVRAGHLCVVVPRFVALACVVSHGVVAVGGSPNGEQGLDTSSRRGALVASPYHALSMYGTGAVAFTHHHFAACRRQGQPAGKDVTPTWQQLSVHHQVRPSAACTRPGWVQAPRPSW